MIDRDPLFTSFRKALNAELAMLGCKLSVADRNPGGEQIVLLAADGRELGLLPDQVDAPTIVAFERILDAS